MSNFLSLLSQYTLVYISIFASVPITILIYFWVRQARFYRLDLGDKKTNLRTQAVEQMYLDHCLELLETHESTREFSKLSPKIGLHDVYVKLFLKDMKKQRFKYSYSYFTEAKETYFHIVGSPGSGKTSLAKRIFYDAVNEYKQVENIDKKFLPLLFAAVRFSNDKTNHLPSLLSRQISPTPSHRLHSETISHLLAERKILIILDGLDELTNDIEIKSLCTNISKWSIKYKSARFVLTSRPSIQLENYASFKFCKVDIEPFTDGQITKYINRWTESCFADLSGMFEDPSPYQQNKVAIRARTLEKIVFENDRLKELASTPLLLTLMATTHHFSGSLGSSQAFLYQNVTELLLQKSKIKISTHELVSIIGQIGYRLHLDRKSLFSIEDFYPAVEQSFLHKGVSLSEDEFRDLLTKSGLFFYLESNVVSFVHIGFQEYFAAQYMIHHPDALLSKVKLMDDEWWRNVILLSAESYRSVQVVCRTLVDTQEIDGLNRAKYVVDLLKASKNTTLNEKNKILHDAAFELSRDYLGTRDFKVLSFESSSENHDEFLDIVREG